MADTTNYGWPQPDPQGIQQTEIARIATALGLADDKVKTIADLIAALTFVQIGGKIADAQMRDGMRRACSQTFDGVQISDWNDIRANGNYMKSDAANAPEAGAGWWIVRVQTHIESEANAYVTQIAHQFTSDLEADTRLYRRSCNGGVWGNWYRLRWSEAEIQAMIDATVTAGIDGLLDAAPSTLDTLNELAAAIGDDPNFAATISAQIGSKLPAANYTAADVLAKLKSVDGPTSGLSVSQADNAAKLGGELPAHYLDVTGGTLIGELKYVGPGNNYRLKNGAGAGAYGAFWRIDANNLYLMLTPEGSPDGNWRSDGFALTVNLATGKLDAGNGLAVAGYDVWHAGNLDVDAKIAALINGSPGALDTLNELAAAMGDDPNFAATMTNALAGKLGINAKAADSARLGGALPNAYQPALGYTPVQQGGGTGMLTNKIYIGWDSPNVLVQVDAVPQGYMFTSHATGGAAACYDALGDTTAIVIGGTEMTRLRAARMIVSGSIRIIMDAYCLSGAIDYRITKNDVQLDRAVKSGGGAGRTLDVTVAVSAGDVIRWEGLQSGGSGSMTNARIQAAGYRAVAVREHI